MTLLVGQVLHHLKAAGWGCARVEAVGHDWAVCRGQLGGAVLVQPDDVAEHNEHHSDGYETECPFNNH